MKNILFGNIIRKIILSIIVITIGVLSYTSTLDLLLEKIYIGTLDNKGNTYLNETLTRAVYTFALARAVNGVISVVQGTELSGTPGGVGIKFAVGEILDPLNDLIERFSWVMLISTTSLGIQKMFMEIGKWFGFEILICLSMFIILIGIWIQHISGINLIALGYKLIIISIIIRFCIPAVAIASNKVYDLFLKSKYIESTQSLEEIKEEIKNPDSTDDQTKKGDLSFWENLITTYQDLKESINIKHKLSFLTDKVSNAVKYIINLIVVFVLQTILMPIIFLWILLKVTGYLFRSSFLVSTEQRLIDYLLKGGKVSGETTNSQMRKAS